MKSFPTPLSPWFILVKYMKPGFISDVEYYTTQGEKEFSPLKSEAFLFQGLTSAVRTVNGFKKLHIDDKYDLITLYDKSQLGQYGRDVYE